MRAVLAALTLITSGAEARGTEIYRNYTDKRHRCFEHSRPAQRRLKKQKADAEAAGAAPADDKAARKAAKKAKKEAKAATAAAEAPAAEPAAAPPTPTNGDEVKSVFCTNLAWAIDDDAIKAHFADAGSILKINSINGLYFLNPMGPFHLCF